jgi:hypothetical protein
VLLACRVFPMSGNVRAHSNFDETTNTNMILHALHLAIIACQLGAKIRGMPTYELSPNFSLLNLEL